MLQQVAGLPDAARIDGLGTLLDVLHNPLLVDQKTGAHGQTLGRVQNSILLADVSLEVAQQGKGEAILLGKSMVAGRGVDADA